MNTVSLFPVSFEVYPPRTPDKLPDLHASIKALDEVSPEFISVTFGAGGSSTRDSLEVLTFIKHNTRATPLAHLTCVGTSAKEVKTLIHQFLDEGINHFLALRGDLPPGESEHSGELMHAEHLVELMATGLDDSPSIERIAVAAFPNGHPESTTLDQDIEVLLRKQQAGASVAITQLFFYVEHYVAFVEKARSAGVTIPLLPGLMPVTSPTRLKRILELTGEESPRELESALTRAASIEEQHRIGVDWCASMIRELVDEGAPGIHLYAFNQHETVLSALEEAGVR